MTTSKWLLRKSGTAKYTILVSSLLQCLAALCGVGIAFAMRGVIDRSVTGDMDGVLRAAIFFAVLICVQILLRAGSRMLSDESNAIMVKSLRQEAFSEILKKDYTEASAYHSGELLTRMTSDVSVVAEGTSSLFPKLISSFVKMAGVLAALYITEPVLALIFAIGGIAFIVASNIPRGLLGRLHHRVQESDGAARCFLQECLESLLVIHAFGNEKKMEQKNGAYLDVYRGAMRRRSLAGAFFSTVISVIMQGGYFIGFIWCCLGIAGGSVSYGTMMAVVQLIGQIQTPFSEMGSVIPKLSAIMASAERLMEISDDEKRASDHSDLSNTVAIPCADYADKPEASILCAEKIYSEIRDIVFDRVSFSYGDGREVLCDASFTVGKGEFVAFVGESGIGKSTLMKLMLSVYRPQSGGIYGNTFDGGMLSVDVFPSGMFAYVPQENHLMSGSIRDAVAFAERSDTVSEERLVAACRAACAHEFITELPDGYNTLLGERGSGLSEGQMQRIAVARAIYSGCPIMLLDEATSALDSDTERRMIRAMKELPDRTIFLITHRTDTLALCDRVVRFGADGTAYCCE